MNKLTDDDIARLAQVFVTKEEFNREIEKLVTKEEHNDLMNKIDAVFGEVKTMRMEQAAHFQQHQDIDEKFIRSDKRIKKLEATVYNG